MQVASAFFFTVKHFKDFFQRFFLNLRFYDVDLRKTSVYNISNAATASKCMSFKNKHPAVSYFLLLIIVAVVLDEQDTILFNIPG